MHQHLNAFAGHEVDKAIEEQMALTYVPVELADLRMMASFPGTIPGKESLVYFEVLDWAWPKTYFVDIPLMGLLEPWDFSATAPFDPAMQEGDFRVIARRRPAEEERRHRQVDVFACGKRCREGVRIQQEEHAPMGPQRA